MSFIDGAACDAVFLLIHLIQWTVLSFFFREVRNLHIVCGQASFQCQKWPFCACFKERKMGFGHKSNLKLAFLGLGRAQVRRSQLILMP